jgi:predicted RND superfamily exporter protein
LDEQRLLQALFFLELYDLEKSYMDADSLNITITLKNADHSSVIQFVENYQSFPIYMTDTGSLSQSSKMEKMFLLISSLLSALLIISLAMGIIFRSFKIGWVGFAANAIPLIWFILFMILFKFELTIEALIAMTISVGLTSDTIIHFGYKYFRSRYFGRTRKHALEIMFFYAAVPAIISAALLMIVFTLLTFTQLQSLQLIGAYGAVLMFISLLSDLFILPVLLLAVDRQEKQPNVH